MRQKIIISGTSALGRAGFSVGYYRLYLLAEPGGKFVGFEELEAEDDAEAVRVAEGHVGAQALELWCGKRKVRTFAPKMDQS